MNDLDNKNISQVFQLDSLNEAESKTHKQPLLTVTAPAAD